jgi:endoglucanase
MDKKLLYQILSCPTAPYRESQVATFVKKFLEAENIPHMVDPIGNIIVGADSKENYIRKVKSSSKEPLRFFIAHMDHPGFHGQKWVNGKTLAVKWLGGTPRKFLNGAKVWLATQDGIVGEGVIQKAILNSHNSALESSEILIKKWKSSVQAVKTDAKALYGSFLFSAPVWEKNRVIYTKAADDLVGVFSILTLAKKLKKNHSRFLGLISRAEEVGFIGTIGHLDLGWLDTKKDSVVVVSLETSRTLPGALIGKGPIVRLGDRATPFDPGLTQVLTQIAQTTLPERFQRRIMDGGTCEATAAIAFGFKAMGISIPLGNYHNQSFEGGPESRGEWGPAPEFVHITDIEGMLSLCDSLMKSDLPWQEPWKKRKMAFIASKKEASKLLKLS